MRWADPRVQRAALGALGALLVALLVLPLMALLGSITPAELLSGLAHPLVGPALRLSLITSGLSLAAIVVLGTPLAWLLANSTGRPARWLESVLQLPIVIPPAVAGVALLLTFGRRGVLAGWLLPAGGSVAFTSLAVILAQSFVSAPFFVQAAISAFRRVDPKLLLVARSLGAPPLSVFWRLALPLARPGLLAGAAMAWARGLGEFGATLMFAGNLEGRTQTLPLAIYTALEADLRVAQALSVVLVVVAFALLWLARALHRRALAGDP